MPKDRFYIDAPLMQGDVVTLTSTEAHHLLQVMRSRVGSQVELVNGRGVLATARLDRIDRRDCDLMILDASTRKSDPTRLIIAQALPRMNRLDTILEKGTELGMHSLWLFPGERSERTEPSDQQKIRLQTVMIAAMKQCGRLDLPTVEWKPPLDQWSKLQIPAFFGSLSEGAPSFSSAWRATERKESAIFFVGPEAGFSPLEEQCLQQLGAIGVTLHRNILRTDTAPLVALSVMTGL